MKSSTFRVKLQVLEKQASELFPYILTNWVMRNFIRIESIVYIVNKKRGRKSSQRNWIEIQKRKDREISKTQPDKPPLVRPSIYQLFQQTYKLNSPVTLIYGLQVSQKKCINNNSL